MTPYPKLELALIVMLAALSLIGVFHEWRAHRRRWCALIMLDFLDCLGTTPAPGRELYRLVDRVCPMNYGTFYTMMRELEESGFVTRIVSADEDGKLALYSLTEKGEEQLKA